MITMEEFQNSIRLAELAVWEYEAKIKEQKEIIKGCIIGMELLHCQGCHHFVQVGVLCQPILAGHCVREG